MDFWHRIRHELRACCDLLLPPACLLCDARLPVGHPAAEFCPTCAAGIPARPTACCRVCAEPLSAPGPDLCAACRQQPPPFARVHTVAPYAGTLQDAVQRFKYRSQLVLERPLGTLLATAVAHGGARPDLIVPVPLHRDRLRERSYNQALQLARQVGRRLAVPVAPAVLCRTRATTPQQGLDAVARRGNLRGAFAVTGAVSSRRILLIDDVMTTGTTVRECAEVLRRAGAASVEVAVLGRA